MISREVRGLERAMDALSARYTAEANNVANVNTPGYVRQDVNFEDALSQAIDSEPSAGQSEASSPMDTLFSPKEASSDDMLELFQPTVTKQANRPMRVDGNGISIEAEMSEVVKTAQKYNTIATQLATQYRTFKYITDAK